MRAAVRAVYRSRQFIGALRPRIDAGLRMEALGPLREPERQLFEAMTRRDQQHCLEVYRRLRTQGHADHDLRTTALRHHVGKGRVAPWHRAAYAVVEAGAPRRLRRPDARSDGRGGRQARGVEDEEGGSGGGGQRPGEEGSGDVVIRHGVIRRGPDKVAVMTEIARVLRPGGRIQIADIGVHLEVPQDAKDDIDLWSG